MIPVDQTIFGSSHGNCMQACIASILEVEINSLPNFMEDGPDNFENKFNKWIDDQPFCCIEIIISDVNLVPHTYMIATGESPRNKDINHAVVYYNGKMVHDPHPDKTGIVGKPKSYTIFVIKDPSKFIKYKEI